MDTYLNQQTQAREVFLKKINKIFLIKILILILSFQSQANESSEKIKKEFVNYINKFDDFSSNFIQSDNSTIEEGVFYIKNKRIRLDYKKPSKITLIIAHNKAMYFNRDVNEVEYFNPENSIANLLYDFFYDKSFIENTKILDEINRIVIEKEIIIEDKKSKIKIFFENNPLIIRRIELKNEDYSIKFAIINTNFYSNLDKKMFSMINPLIN